MLMKNNYMNLCMKAKVHTNTTNSSMSIPLKLKSSKKNTFDFAEYENFEFSDNPPIDNLHIKKARCDKYILKKDENEGEKKGKETCHCGRALRDHAEDVKNRYAREGGAKEGEKWSLDTCSAEDGPTDAFGEVRFINNNDNVAKYIRVHYKTGMDVMEKLFTYWKLKDPKLIISVTGGAKKFSLKPRLQEVFRRGLVKAASSTGAWISTGGFNVGVMKHVGEAIRENASTLNPKEKIVVLGIATWDMALHKEQLRRGVQPKDDHPIDYSLRPENESDKGQPLDPNHTHFILVDNGQVKNGGEIEFRAKLEAAISKRKSENGNDIPIVLLVLEGGVGTLRTVLESVKNGTPCVFIEGSGKCADIFAFAKKFMNKNGTVAVPQKEVKTKDVENPDDKVTRDVKTKLRKMYPEWEEKDYDRMYQMKLKAREKIDAKLRNEIKERIRKEWPKEDVEDTYNAIEIILGADDLDLLSVFSLDAGDKAYDIDVAILNALLRAKRNNYIQQLKLAMTWNRVDMARDYIFNQDIKPESKYLDEIMYTAIMDDRVDFVKLLLQNGFNLKMFLTNRCLLKLYNDALTNKKNKSIAYLSLLQAQGKLIANKRNYDFKQIGEIIQVLVEDLYEPKFTKGDYTKINITACLAETNEFGKVHHYLEKQMNGVTANIHSDLDMDDRCENPEHELFIFSILLIRPNMAKVFWREGSNELFIALLATKIFKIVARIDDEDAEELNANACEFEEIAKSVLDDCYKTDEESSQLLLIRQIPEFGNLTCLQVAVSASDLVFVSHPCVQGLLTKLWYNKIVPDTPRFALFASVFCPLFAPLAITFREDRTQRNDGTSGGGSTKPKNGYKQEDIESAGTGKLNNAAHMVDSNEIDFMDSGKKLTVGDKIFFFIKAPIIKFIYSQIFYTLFVMLFSYVMLCDFYPVPPSQSITNLGLVISIPEILLIIWVTLFAVDEVRQFLEIDVKIFRARFRIFFYNIWNCLELLAIVLFYIGLILRFIPINITNFDVYMAARVIMCIDLILWYLKCLSFYTVIKNLGPKLVMINRMMYELLYFIFIVIIFMFGFGVSTQALMYHNQELNTELLKQVFFPAYFIIGGEYFTRDTIMTAGTCEQQNDSMIEFDRYTQSDCPNYIGAQVSLAIYVVYLIILNILLVNLLIAIFSNTFDEVQIETDKIWKFQRYSLIYEYFHKPILAPPFSAFSYFISIIRIILRPIRKSCCKNLKRGEKNIFKRLFVYLSKDWKTGFVMEFDKAEEKWLSKWEDIISDAFLHQQDRLSKETTEYKLQDALDQIEVLSRKFDEISDTRDNIKAQIEKCDEKIERIWQLLSSHFSDNNNSHNHRDDNRHEHSSTVMVRPSIKDKSSIDRDVILSPSNIKNLTSVETEELSFQVQNEKSRTPHYPKSNVTRTVVPDNKVAWSIYLQNYNPVEYTAKSVLASPISDNNLLAYPSVVRPELDFNKVDERYKVDRRSCLGVYQVAHGLPLNPLGRTGLTGRGSLHFWGPNHAIEAVITRWKRDEAGGFVIKGKGSKVLQFIILEKSIHLKQWHLPHVLLEHTDQNDSILLNRLLSQVFSDDVISDNIGKLKNLLNKGEKLDEYYKDCQRNTDNAWIETTVMNYHDENGSVLSKLPLRESASEISAAWKDFDRKIENENQDDWNCLKLVAQKRNASFELL